MQKDEQRQPDVARVLDTLRRKSSSYPERVVCLTEEPTETLYRIGGGNLVKGVSGFTVRPEAARRKPKVSTFLDANFDALLALEPDLVIGFSDLQKDIARELVGRGINVVIFNQRSIAEILSVVRMTAALVGLAPRGESLADEFMRGLDVVAARTTRPETAPRVFFEEWPDPLITGIRWVSELVEIAGGVDVCAESRSEQGAKGRIVDAAVVATRDPEIIMASWCGKMAKVDTIRSRPGFSDVTAVKCDHIFEIKSPRILQPGPAALTDGVRDIASIIDAVIRGDDVSRPRVDACRSAPHFLSTTADGESIDADA